MLAVAGRMRRMRGVLLIGGFGAGPRIVVVFFVVVVVVLFSSTFHGPEHLHFFFGFTNDDKEFVRVRRRNGNVFFQRYSILIRTF